MDALPHPIGATPRQPPRGRVYLDFYQLNEAPFAITPDPEFLFAAGSHQQAIDKITYAIENRMGFILLTGEVGTGKTTVCRTLLDRLSDRAETVYIINPSVSGIELLTAILEDARIAVGADTPKKALIDHLYRHLLSREASRPFVVIIDDAQTMPLETLEDLRLLSNLETDKHKLIQVVLSGQPELIALLGGTGLRQLKQRIAIHCRLSALSAEETDAYIAQRLFVAGNQGQVRFSKDATRLAHRTADGIPRLINKICDYALTAGYVKDARVIDGSHVRLAASELKDLGSQPAMAFGRQLGVGAAVFSLILLAALAAFTLFSPGGMSSHRRATTDTSVAGILPPITTSASAAPDQSPGQPIPAPDMSMQPVSLVEPPAAAEDSAARPIPPTELDPVSAKTRPPAPYAMQLGSFSTRNLARQSVDRYRNRGIPAHWQAVNAGQWYRVIAGKFDSLTVARQYQSDHGLNQALIINAPLTVKVMPGQPTVSPADIPDFLSEMGHGCLMETGLAGDNEFYTGLFSKVEDASLVAETVNASGRFVAQVVKR